uniref:Uncharacterized protein n=1 Tax=Lepeophtheirus salmonis TaxID=72036 RepID=A0A0K2U9M6_LEPSM
MNKLNNYIISLKTKNISQIFKVVFFIYIYNTRQRERKKRVICVDNNSLRILHRTDDLIYCYSLLGRALLSLTM